MLILHCRRFSFTIRRSEGRSGRTSPPSIQFLFIFMQFLGKIEKNNRLAPQPLGLVQSLRNPLLFTVFMDLKLVARISRQHGKEEGSNTLIVYDDICRRKCLQQTLSDKPSDTGLPVCVSRRNGPSSLRLPLQVFY